MSKTRRELVLRTLAVLGIGSVGQAPLDDDYTAVNDMVPSLVARLYAEEDVYLGNTETFEDASFEPISALLARDMIDVFALGFEEAQRVTALADNALARLKRQLRGAPTYAPLKVDYF